MIPTNAFMKFCDTDHKFIEQKTTKLSHDLICQEKIYKKQCIKNAKLNECSFKNYFDIFHPLSTKKKWVSVALLKPAS